MAVPLSYNFRNLLVRKTTTWMTALGMALTVAVVLGILGMLAGLESSFQATGHPLHLIVLRKGSTAEMSSAVSRESFQVWRAKEGMQTENGESMISHELVTVVSLGLRGGGESNVNVRGQLEQARGQLDYFQTLLDATVIRAPVSGTILERAVKVRSTTSRGLEIAEGLAGGQEQRVAIARAIVTDPAIILADEPTGDPDANSAQEILTIRSKLNREHGKTIVLVTHDPHAARYAAKIRYLEKGERRPEGATPDN